MGTTTKNRLLVQYLSLTYGDGDVESQSYQ